MPLSTFFEKIVPVVEKEMQDVVALAGQRGTPKLAYMLAYHMGWEGEGSGPKAQGKRIRPILVCLVNAAAGGSWQTAVPAASAVELLHNFSLIHDDIEDNSPLRRGRPTLWNHWGIPQAINTGDTLFTLAFMGMQRLQQTLSPALALEAQGIFQDTCLHLTQGQHLDIAFETRLEIQPEEYWPMIGGKTAALLAGCAELGALTANASPKVRQAYREFGRGLGLAFQVLDDYLGIWGDAAQTGKSAESDLVEGKKSLPVLFGLAKQGAFARRWAEGPIRVEDVPEAAALLASEGALDYTKNEAARLTALALQALDEAQPQGEAGLALRELAGLLLQRQA